MAKLYFRVDGNCERCETKIDSCGFVRDMRALSIGTYSILQIRQKITEMGGKST